jgi:chromosomal replication initiator protein
MTPLSLDERTRILSFLETRLEPKVYDTWCRGLELQKIGENSVRVPSANPYYRDWLDRLLRKPLEEAFLDVFGSAPEIVFEVGPAPVPELEPPRIQEPAPVAAPSLNLNPSFTFENFIEGPSNRMAVAAAAAASENPARLYNPLFIHGGVGLGKTHLLQAICHAVLARKPNAKVAYLSCEDFVNGYISAVQNLGRMEAFRARYRKADVLAVDDIHFLRGKEGSQEEFYHTFNSLHLAGRQVVLSSDQPAVDIPTLKAQLVSRFTSGFDAQIDPPTYETRLAILRRKVLNKVWDVPDAVLEEIAQAVESNIRDLEGKLTQVMGYALVSKQTPDAVLAREVLNRGGSQNASVLTLSSIQQVVAKHFGKKSSELQARRSTRSTARARQVCLYLGRQLTDSSLEELGNHFGGKDHSTVLYAIRQVEARLEKDPSLEQTLEQIKRELRRI